MLPLVGFTDDAAVLATTIRLVHCASSPSRSPYSGGGRTPTSAHAVKVERQDWAREDPLRGSFGAPTWLLAEFCHTREISTASK